MSITASRSRFRKLKRISIAGNNALASGCPLATAAGFPEEKSMLFVTVFTTSSLLS
jgi:hypothetical protein